MPCDTSSWHQGVGLFLEWADFLVLFARCTELVYGFGNDKKRLMDLQRAIDVLYFIAT